MGRDRISAVGMAVAASRRSPPNNLPWDISRVSKGADQIAIAAARRSVPTDGDTMSTPIPTSTLGDPDALLTRDATAASLTAAGYSIAAKTLAGKATRGDGRPYGLFASRALYRWCAWAWIGRAAASGRNKRPAGPRPGVTWHEADAAAVSGHQALAGQPPDRSGRAYLRR